MPLHIEYYFDFIVCTTFVTRKIKENPRPLLIQNFNVQAVNFT